MAPIEAYLELAEPTGVRRIPLRAGDTVLGRHDVADVVIRDGEVSRRHASFRMEDGRVDVRDMGSKNGTFLNDRRLDGPAQLVDGDRVRIGDVVLQFRTAQALQLQASHSIERLGTLRPSLMDLSLDLSAGDEDAMLRVLLRVTEELVSPAPAAEMFDRVLRLCSQIIEADRLTLLIVDDGAIVPVATVQMQTNEGEQPFSRQIAHAAWRSRKAMRFDDIDHDPRVVVADSVFRAGIRSALCAPMVHEGEVLGVLYVDHLAKTNHYTNADLDLLAAFANQAALALHSARLRDQLEDHAVLQRALLRYFPPLTAEKLLGLQGATVAPSELEVTVLFTDIVSYTERSSGAAPTELLTLLNRYFPPMARIVTERDGMLEKYIGDALMAVWGAPFPQTDGADRALEAAIAMRSALAELNLELAEEDVPPLRVRVGIHSGSVAFGNLGSAEYLQFAAIGDATNVAARVCSAAEPDEIWLTESTRAQLTRLTPRLEALPPTPVKGKEHPLELHRLLD